MVVEFDPAEHGLLSHYPPEAQFRIRRLILEDWKASAVKLPTYMKLVARYISPVGVPEDWLSKLSHQTMSKMLKATSTPRYPFWACLHLYIIKKFGPQEIAPGQSPIEILGQTLVGFAGTCDQIEDQLIHLDEGGELTLKPHIAIPMAQASLTQTVKGVSPLYLEVEHCYSGAAVKQSNKIHALMRHDISLALKSLEIEV